MVPANTILVLVGVAALLLLGWLVLRLEGSLRLLDRSSQSLEGRIGQGLRDANQTFADVLQRLAVIDVAQRQLHELTREVVGLEALLGDRSARGAFGEIQLQGLVENLLPAGLYRFQHVLSTGARADCLLILPEPTGALVVDAKFPLENFRRGQDPELSAEARGEARRRLRNDLRGHIDAIADKYILPGETADLAIMFLPAEALFAELHGALPELVEHAQRRHVCVASPTTLFAILHSAAAVIKDARTREQAQHIRTALAQLAADFGRFDQRLDNLTRHHAQMGRDLEELAITGRQLSRRFRQVEGGEPPA
ncbi:MAG: DNA recombination protein RmuC [Betaproteobacteria bacterium]|nr:DNA recombination protein RmuC [Betaproteobacteria bacterium]